MLLPRRLRKRTKTTRNTCKNTAERFNVQKLCLEWRKQHETKTPRNHLPHPVWHFGCAAMHICHFDVCQRGHLFDTAAKCVEHHFAGRARLLQSNRRDLVSVCVYEEVSAVNRKTAFRAATPKAERVV